MNTRIDATDIRAFRSRLAIFAEGLELLRHLDGDEPGAGYLREKIYQDAEWLEREIARQLQHKHQAKKKQKKH